LEKSVNSKNEQGFLVLFPVFIKSVIVLISLMSFYLQNRIHFVFLDKKFI